MHTSASRSPGSGGRRGGVAVLAYQNEISPLWRARLTRRASYAARGAARASVSRHLGADAGLGAHRELLVALAGAAVGGAQHRAQHAGDEAGRNRDDRRIAQRERRALAVGP